MAKKFEFSILSNGKIRMNFLANPTFVFLGIFFFGEIINLLSPSSESTLHDLFCGRGAWPCKHFSFAASVMFSCVHRGCGKGSLDEGASLLDSSVLDRFRWLHSTSQGHLAECGVSPPAPTPGASEGGFPTMVPSLVCLLPRSAPLYSALPPPVLLSLLLIFSHSRCSHLFLSLFESLHGVSWLGPNGTEGTEFPPVC